MFNTRKSNLGVGTWTDYIWNREGDWWKRENTRKLAKSEPTEPTNNIHTRGTHIQPTHICIQHVHNRVCSADPFA